MSHNAAAHPRPAAAPASPLAKVPPPKRSPSATKPLSASAAAAAVKTKLKLANGNDDQESESLSPTTEKSPSSASSEGNIASEMADSKPADANSTKTTEKPATNGHTSQNPSSSSSSSRPASAVVASSVKRASVPTGTRPASASHRLPLLRAHSATTAPTGPHIALKSPTSASMNPHAHLMRRSRTPKVGGSGMHSSPAFSAANAFPPGAPGGRRGSGGSLGSGSYDKVPPRSGGVSPRGEDAGQQKAKQKRRSKYSRHYRTASSAKGAFHCL